MQGGARGLTRAAIAVADTLLERRGPDLARRLAARERRVELAVAALFAVAAAVMPALSDDPWPDALTVVGLVVTYALVAQVRLQLGSGLVGPTQLVFIPMLFLAPPLAVPALVAAGELLAELRSIALRRAHAERAVVALTDSWYSVGPALVVAALAPADPAGAKWTVFALALVAQFATDYAVSTLREWAGAGIPPSRLAPVLGLVYVVDALLTPVGIIAVLASDQHPHAFVLVLGPAALLAAIGHERRTRIERELVLGRAYRRSTGELQRAYRRVGEAVASRLDRGELERVLVTATVEAVQADHGRLSAGGEPPAAADGSLAIRLPGQDEHLTVTRAGQPFSADERELLEHLATQAAASLENLELHELMRKTEAELRAILEGVTDAIIAEDAAGRIVYANAAALRLDPPRLHLTGEAGEPIAPERLPGRRALAGEDPPPLVVRFRPPGGEPRWARVRASPVPDELGAPRLAITVIEDITEIERAERSQRFLAESAHLLAGSLELDEILPAVARLAVPEIADGCELHVLGERELRLFAAVPAPAGALAARIHEVIRSGSPQLDGDAVVVPMRARARVVGAIGLTASGRRFGPQDLALAEQLGLRVGAVVETARLYRTRSAIAQTLQASLLPPALPEIPALETAALYRAAGEGYEVGGDFYDLFSTREDQWFAVIGDVCGKGAEAAAVTALARYTLRAAVVQHRSPAGMLRWLNDAMLRQRTGPTRFATIACVRFDVDGGATTATVCCAGHPPPRVLRATGLVETLGTTGTLMGVVRDVQLHDVSTRLGSGDALVLYTDGLTEAGAPRRVWTPDELDAAVAATRGAAPQEIVEQLARAALGDQPPQDDLALLALKVR